MSRLPGYKSQREFAEVWGIHTRTLEKQLKRGYCAWPRRQQLGHTNHPLYKTWEGMKARCYRKNYSEFHYYGGRGITVCDAWRIDFWQFVKDMGEKPDKSYTLDRIDNDKGYSPENCRWASGSEQAINQRKRSNNTSGIIGVRFVPRDNRWRFYRTRNGKHFSKYFKTKEEAIKFKEQFNDNTLTDSK